MGKPGPHAKAAKGTLIIGGGKGLGASIEGGLGQAGLQGGAAFFPPGFIGFTRDEDGLVEDEFTG